MNSYAIYRIAETLGVLFFMTLAILIFNFLSIDGSDDCHAGAVETTARFLSIAYDNVHYKEQPEA